MEDIVDTFVNGFKNIFKNPVLFAPMGVLFLALVASTACLILLSIALETILGSTLNYLYALGILYLVYIFVLLVFALYTTAGLVGMSKEAIAHGKTTFSDMSKYGKKFTLRLFLATIVISLFYLISFIFWAPAIYVFMNLSLTLEGFFAMMVYDFDAFISVLSALLIPSLIGLLLTTIYSIILTFVFYFVMYAIVVDDISVIKALKQSFTVLKQNFLKVFAFIVLVFIITMVLSTIASMFTVPILYIAMFSMVIHLWTGLALFIVYYMITIALSLALVVPVTVWATRFYMSVTGQSLYKEESQKDLEI